MATDANHSYVPHWLRIVLVGRKPKFTLVRIAVLVVVVFFVRAYVLLPIRVQGLSMMPTYQDNGINFVNRLAYLHSDPKRFDVVAIRFSGEHLMLMKRIIGLPGETVQFHQGRVLINGEKLDESYENSETYPCDWELPPEKLTPDEYFVVGDNRTMPWQYHKFGKAERSRIVGKVLLCKNLFASSSPQP
jgi:signal peptidase I